MGQILFDEYLKGLTEENFRAALNLSDSDLGKHTLTIKVLKEAKKGGTFWSIQLFLDNKPKGITIGMSGYNESIIKQNIAELQAGNKLRGTWPKNKHFWQWIKQRDPNERADKLAKKRKKREENQQKELAQKKAEELLKKLLAQIPESLDAHIKALQQQAEQQWDKTFLLDTKDLKFIEGYNHPSFNFYIIEADIQTQAHMEKWITAWIARVEAAIAAPSPVDTAIKTILKLIASSPKYGIQTYAMWLGNSKAKSLQNKELNENYRYALKDYTIVAIAAKIETIIGYQWLRITTVGTHRLPVLILTNNGKKILQHLEHKKIKVTATQPATLVFQAAKTVDVHSHIDWLKEIQQKEHTAYVNFLNSPQSVANIANWSEDEVAEMQRTLNERLKGWQVLAQWKLSKHPIKSKLLQRLLR
ncbi:MAG: hypothetical protein ABFS56_00880 [Pseudomonadota bacterium]